MIDTLARENEIIGIKLYPGFELYYPNEERCHALNELCIKYGMPVLFHSGDTMGEPWREKHNSPEQIAQAAVRFPGLKVIIAHFSDPRLTACRDVVLGHPNIYADISGLAYPEVVAHHGAEAISRVVTDMVASQPDKVLFGTDWPSCGVAEHIRFVRELRGDDSVKKLILAGNARALFRLERGEWGGGSRLLDA